MISANSTTTRNAGEPSRWTLPYRFALAGAAIGLAAGLLEAALLYFIPRATGLQRPDTRYVIWFLAPLVDLLTGALLGVALGFAGSLRQRPHAAERTCVAALGLGLSGAYAVWLLDWFRIGPGAMLPRRVEATAVIFPFFLIFLVAAVILGYFRRRLAGFFDTKKLLPLGRWLTAGLIAVAVLAGGVLFYVTHRPNVYSALRRQVSAAVTAAHPNIVLIVLDTVRADHLSCYGYSRPATPNIDRLASRGVLFEDAVAPSSWTLPSIAAIFTGLLPHQNGADWGMPLDAAPRTLARILRRKGYETAGFNSNPFYGLSGWRLGEGFTVYEDDSYSVRHNLAVTFIGQSALSYLYNRLVRYNQFNHRSAEDVNRDVMRWYRQRPSARPFFLFINYMDAHRPYLPPSPYDHRFGRIPRYLLERITKTLKDGYPAKPYTVREQRAIIDGYDNSLAYLDHQVGSLMHFITSEPGGENTIFIVTSDHGEGFGEHGTYDHGWNLYREALQVPLVVAGPGVPAGVRVPSVVANRQLFSTILGLAFESKGLVSHSSLSRYWAPGDRLELQHRGSISELVVFGPANDPTASLSLTTREWHLIWNSGGGLELYNRQKDPEEKTNLAGCANLRDALQVLRTSLEARVAYSVLPWRALGYLAPLDQPGATFIQQITGKSLRLPAQGIPIGSAQAYFACQPPSQLIRPTQAEQDLLRSLPYH